MKRFSYAVPLLTALALGLSASRLPAAPLLAQAVQNVSSDTAQGTTQTGPQRVQLGYQGVNLSFLKTGETIKKVWLDDPTQVVIDFDGCLASQLDAAGGGGGGGTASGNECNGAAIIHLRQLPAPLNFPKGLFAGGNTSLSVVTQNGSERKLYQFQLVLAGGNPPYRTVEVLPSPAPAPAQLVSVSQEYQQTVLRQLSKGLAIAESRQMVDKQSAAYQQVVATVALMQGGKPLAEAMKQTGVPLRLVDRLRGLGSAP